MTDAAIIQATFSEWRMVKGRKVLQLVCEVPLEAQETVLRALGTPGVETDNWVAIARLNLTAKAEEPAQIEHANDDMEDEPGKPPRPLSQVAGMLCNTPTFQQFIREKSDGWDHRPTSLEAADWLRAVCGIQSRSELNTHPVATERFKKIRADYKAWLLVA